MDRQLLLQVGDRLQRLRKAQGVGTVEMAKRVGISRTTLSAVEAGDPGPSKGTYLRVMSVLGIGGDLALLAGDTLQPATPGSAGARSRRGRPVVQVLVSADEARHQVRRLQTFDEHLLSVWSSHSHLEDAGRLKQLESVACGTFVEYIRQIF